MLGISRSSLKTKQPGAAVACITRSAAALPVADLARRMKGWREVRYCSSAIFG